MSTPSDNQPGSEFDAEFERLDLVHSVLSDMVQAAQSLGGGEWVAFGADRAEQAIEAMDCVAAEMTEHLNRGREVSVEHESGWDW